MDEQFSREMEQFLQTKWLGRSVCYQDSVVSTNNLAKELGKNAAPHGLLVLAEEQNGGKGRVGRGWASPHAQGLWFSVLLRPQFLPQEASKCTLMAAVAVAKAVRGLTKVAVQIKWPNDILFQGKKMVGILSEMNAELGHINYVVIGIGIDTHVQKDSLPEDVQDIYVSLQDVAKISFSRFELLCRVLQELEELFEEAETKGFDGIFNQWRKFSCTLGQDVKVIAPDETYFGKAVDLDSTGMLIVRRTDGRFAKVLAGDVSIRPAK